MQKNPNKLIKLKKLNREKNWINHLEKKNNSIWFSFDSKRLKLIELVWTKPV